MTTTNQESDLLSLRIVVIFYRHTLIDINPVKPLNRPSGNDHIGLRERSQSGDLNSISKCPALHYIYKARSIKPVESEGGLLISLHERLLWWCDSVFLCDLILGLRGDTQGIQMGHFYFCPGQFDGFIKITLSRRKVSSVMQKGRIKHNINYLIL